MTLDGAIKEFEHAAEKYMEYGIETECYQCGKEHEQLAEWLKMADKYIKVSEIVEYCNTYSACLQGKGQSVTQAALRRVKEYAIENAADVDRWINVDDRVPDISGKYLCYLATGEMEVQEFCREINDDEYNNNYPFGCWVTYPSDDGGECREWIEILEITHWQPLPEPPKGR